MSTHTPVTTHVWDLEDSSVTLVLSAHLHTSSRNGTQPSQLGWQGPLPTEPPRQPLERLLLGWLWYPWTVTHFMMLKMKIFLR